MAKLDQLARPMMGRTAGFHTDETLGQLREEGQYVLAPERLGDDHAPRSVNAMNLKNMLGQIEADGRDRRRIGDRLSHGPRFIGNLSSQAMGMTERTAKMEADRTFAGSIPALYVSRPAHLRGIRK